MKKVKIDKRVLEIGTAVIWGAVLLGVSLLTDAEGSRALDWPVMWVIIGGYLIHTMLIKFLSKKD